MPRVAILGASGGIGQRIVSRSLDKGYSVAGQTRDATKLGDLADQIDVHAFEPTDEARLAAFVDGADLVVFALGIDRTGGTTLFSDATNALIRAMKTQGVKRLIAITGIGAGETKGHGGFLYDWIIYPLFTRNRYTDKTRQEAQIAATDLDWIIVRPAAYSDAKPSGPLEVHTSIDKNTVLRRIARDEVAGFVVEQFESDRYLRQRPFIGHA